MSRPTISETSIETPIHQVMGQLSELWQEIESQASGIDSELSSAFTKTFKVLEQKVSSFTGKESSYSR